MCQENNITKIRKGKHLEYSERQSIERWYNKDKRTKVEIAGLLERTEKTIRNEIKRGLVKNLTSELVEIWVYSADVAQQRYEYYLRAKGPKLKIDNDYELKEYVEKSIKKDKKSPEVIAKEIKEMDFKAKMCAKTIRNNIAHSNYQLIIPETNYEKQGEDNSNGSFITSLCLTLANIKKMKYFDLFAYTVSNNFAISEYFPRGNFYLPNSNILDCHMVLWQYCLHIFANLLQNMLLKKEYRFAYTPGGSYLSDLANQSYPNRQYSQFYGCELQ